MSMDSGGLGRRESPDSPWGLRRNEGRESGLGVFLEFIPNCGGLLLTGVDPKCLCGLTAPIAGPKPGIWICNGPNCF